MRCNFSADCAAAITRTNGDIFNNRFLRQSLQNFIYKEIELGARVGSISQMAVIEEQ